MTSITQIGLGPMGIALADCLISNDYNLTVWNRTTSKMASFVDRGAQAADSIDAAVAASSTVIVCLRDYSSTLELFRSVKDETVFSGRTIIQLSTGRTHEAHALNDWLTARGASYLDGAILGAPHIIGEPDAVILVAGNEKTWQKSRATLQLLAGKAAHAGAQIDAASLLDLAFLCQRLGAFMGAMQGIALCQASGLKASTFGETVASDNRIKMLTEVIANESYDEPVNSIALWTDGFQHIVDQANETNCPSAFLDFLADRFRQANAAGLGGEDIAALIKTFG
ncbi:MAG: NAD(P)-binding domain-containing protein [Pseudomonadota bacterium]